MSEETKKPIETPEDVTTEVTEEVAVDATEEKTTAKAGKRSAKALAEAEALVAKKEKAADDTEDVKKNPAPKSRPLIERRGKKYQEVAKLLEDGKVYELSEALELATKTSTTKFDASVEMHIRLGVDPRQADQNIRATIVLPEGTGKDVRVAVYAEDDDVKKALAAGAEVAGNEDFLAQLEKGVIDFDVLVATPMMMPKLAKYARVLGPKGLMPNPKSGTVTTDVATAVKDSKAGKLEYRVDSQAIVHVNIGKVSFGKAKLQTNADAFVTSLKNNKPSGLKGNFIRSAFVTTAMGPSIKINLV